MTGPQAQAAPGEGSSALAYREREAGGKPSGLLVLHHGRGSNEGDLMALAAVLDPERRLHVVSPRAPIELPGSPGYHWYLVPRAGHPDPETFGEACSVLGTFHDELWRRTGIEPARTVLGGFSMGAAMSYAVGLGAGRPLPAGILALSGFLPTMTGWRPDLAGRAGLPVLIAHGARDSVLPVALAREAERALREGGLPVEYHESESAHHVDPRQLHTFRAWVDARLPSSA